MEDTEERSANQPGNSAAAGETRVRRKFFNRDFSLFFQAASLSYFGDVIYNLAISYWVLQTTGSTALMGTAIAISSLPRIFLSPYTGALADRYDRKLIFCSATLFRAVLMCGIALLTFQNRLVLPILFVSTFLLSAAGSFANPAVASILPDLVEKEDVVRGISLKSAAYSFVDLSGNGISGYFINWFGIPMMILLNAASFLFYFLSMLFVRVPKHQVLVGAKQKKIWHDMKDGIAFFYQNIGLRLTLLYIMMANLFTIGIFNLLMAMFLQQGFNIEQFGVMMSFLSFGSLIGFFITGFYRFPTKYNPLIIMGGFLLLCLSYMLMLLTNHFYLICFLLCLGMIGNSMSDSTLDSVLMLGVEAQQRGKLSGIITTVCAVFVPISTLFYGGLGEVMPLSTLFFFGFLLAGIATVMITFSPAVRGYLSLYKA